MAGSRDGERNVQIVYHCSLNGGTRAVDCGVRGVEWGQRFSREGAEDAEVRRGRGISDFKLPIAECGVRQVQGSKFEAGVRRQGSGFRGVWTAAFRKSSPSI